MRQTHLALNNDMQRVQRVFLATGSCCRADSTLARDIRGSSSSMRATAATARAAAAISRVTNARTRIFIVDPLGNLMMRFDTRANPKGLHEDLQKLLKLSHIG